VCSYLKNFHVTSRGRDGFNEWSCTLTTSTEVPPPLSEALEHFEVPDGYCYVDGETYHIQIEDCRVSFGGPPRLQRVDLWLGGSEQSTGTTTRAKALGYALQAGLRRGGLFGLHAASLLEPESGRGILIAGQSSSGKSSLTLRLASQGWSYLADESSLAYDCGTHVEVTGWRRQFTVAPESLSLCVAVNPEAAVSPLPNEPEKVRVNPAILFPNKYANAASPYAVFFPIITGDEKTEIKEISHSHAMGQLIKLAPWSGYDVATGHKFLNLLSKLVAQSRTYLLFSGKDIFVDPAYASALLSSYATI
jgi:hypothetical protein